MTQENQTAVLLFAKSPAPGQVKTRLAKDIGDAEAVKLYRELLTDKLRLLEQLAGFTVCCFCAPDGSHEFFKPWQNGKILFFNQQGADLGERMFNAAKQSRELASRFILMGVDCPLLDASVISQADAVLRQGNDAVIVPAEDGGYVLLGFHSPHEFLFESVNWGSAKVFAQTRSAFKKLAWSWSELQTLWDIDRLEDYQRYLASGMGQ